MNDKRNCCEKCYIAKAGGAKYFCDSCPCHTEKKDWEVKAGEIAITAHKQSKHYAKFSEIIYQGVKEAVETARQERDEVWVKKLKKLQKEDRNPQWKWIMGEAIKVILNEQ